MRPASRVCRNASCHVGNGAGVYASGRAGRPQRSEGVHEGVLHRGAEQLERDDKSRDNAARSRSKDARLPLALSAASTSPLLRCETDTRACAHAWNRSRGRPRVSGVHAAPMCALQPQQKKNEIC